MTSYQRYQVGEVNMARKKFSCRQYYVSFCISPGVAHCLLISLSCVHWKKENDSISELKKTNFKTFSLQRKVDVGKIWLNTKRVHVSSAGNRTPVSRVTGGDTHHYTTEDVTCVNIIYR